MMYENAENLSEGTVDMKRALDSLQEELEAIDWYNQRVDACKDGNLKKLLQHNADEEKEHAAMLLEWIRQHDEKFSEHLKEYLFKDVADVASLEDE